MKDNKKETIDYLVAHESDIYSEGGAYGGYYNACLEYEVYSGIYFFQVKFTPNCFDCEADCPFEYGNDRCVREYEVGVNDNGTINAFGKDNISKEDFIKHWLEYYEDCEY